MFNSILMSTAASRSCRHNVFTLNHFFPFSMSLSLSLKYNRLFCLNDRVCSSDRSFIRSFTLQNNNTSIIFQVTVYRACASHARRIRFLTFEIQRTESNYYVQSTTYFTELFKLCNPTTLISHSQTCCKDAFDYKTKYRINFNFPYFPLLLTRF